MRLAGQRPCSLWARRAESVEQARSLGIEGATQDLAEAVLDADLIVLSVPVGAMPGLVSTLQEVGIPEQALLTDVGSVKQVVHQTIGATLRQGGHRFIGGHPMAGSESRGVLAARPDLFEGAACLLTDDDGVGAPWVKALEEFWTMVGCRVRWMESSLHDQLVARISHFPHVMASATAGVALADPEDARFGGGGLRDTTRVAGGDATMWAEILLENKEAVAASVREVQKSLSDVLAFIEGGDHEAVREWLAAAQLLHEKGRAAKREQSNQ